VPNLDDLVEVRLQSRVVVNSIGLTYHPIQ